MKTPDFSNAPIADRQTLIALNERQSGGNNLLVMLFEIFCDEMPTLLAALDLSWDSRNRVDAEEAIHRIKGSAASMGAFRLRDVAKLGLDTCLDGVVFTIEDFRERLRKEIEAYQAEVRSFIGCA